MFWSSALTLRAEARDVQAPIKDRGVFGDNSLQKGQDCAVLFVMPGGEEQVFFGRVIRVVTVAGSGKRELEYRLAVSLKQKPPNTKVYCAWYEEVAIADDIHPDDLVASGVEVEPLPCFQLMTTDNIPGAS